MSLELFNLGTDELVKLINYKVYTAFVGEIAVWVIRDEESGTLYVDRQVNSNRLTAWGTSGKWYEDVLTLGPWTLSDPEPNSWFMDGSIEQKTENTSYTSTDYQSFPLKIIDSHLSRSLGKPRLFR